MPIAGNRLGLQSGHFQKKTQGIKTGTLSHRRQLSQMGAYE